MTDTVSFDVERYALTQAILAGSQVITLPASPQVITASSEILIMKMAGPNVGAFETAIVDVVTNNIVSLVNPLTNNYNISDKTVVQYIPNYTSVTVESGGSLIAPSWNGSTGGTIFFRAITVTVNAAGMISVDRAGYAAGNGPGASSDQSLGGSHGGYGGRGYQGEGTPGNPYGNVYQPHDLGSGGHSGNGGSGGAGGGAIHLVSGLITLNGTLSANGANGIGGTTGGGGGSGGSIWIQTTTLDGDGTIQAKGGNGGSAGSYDGGGGSGGRIAIEAATDTFSSEQDKLQVQGGSSPGREHGGPGTVYFKLGLDKGELWVDNSGIDSLSAGLPAGEYDFDTIKLTGYGDLTMIGTTSVLTLTSSETITGDGTAHLIVPGTTAAPSEFTISGYTLVMQGRLSGPEVITTTGQGGLDLYASTPWHTGVYTFTSLYIGAGTQVNLFPHIIANSIYTDDYGIELRVSNLTIEGDGNLASDGRGYGAAEGPGVGSDYSVGASHGGYGGRGYFGGGTPGTPYGNVYQPRHLGSGGLTYWGTGGNGGGAIHLVADLITLNGTLSVNGANGGKHIQAGGGGGSGGSVWIETSALTGSGMIQANGGNGGNGGDESNNNIKGGGGGGGRIAIYATTDNLSGPNSLQVQGGTGREYGGPGTIYLNRVDPLTSTIEISPASIPANGVAMGTITVTLRNITGTLLSEEPISVTVKSGDDVYIDGRPAPKDTAIDLGLTDANGVVTAVITSTRAETKTVEAYSGWVRLITPTTVYFDPARVDAGASSVEIVGPDEAAADGVETVQVLVTARDAFGNLVPGLPTGLSTHPAATVSPDIPPDTDENGEATFSVSHDQPAQVVISATVDRQTVSQTATATFKGPDLAITKTGTDEIEPAPNW